MYDPSMALTPKIDTAVDVDGNFVYDPEKSVDENYAIWLGFIYDTFAGIANGDSYIELIEQFADETTIAVTTERGTFYNLDGLPERVLGILRDPLTSVDDLANCPYTLDIEGGLHLQAALPSMLRLNISNSAVLGSEVQLIKAGEEHDEPIDIMSNGTLVGTISQSELLVLLISMNKDSSIEVPDTKELSAAEFDAAFGLLITQLGEQKGCSNTENKIYGAVQPEIEKTDIANGGIVVRRLETPEESLMHIDIVHHELLEELDSDVIYRLHSELVDTSGEPTSGHDSNGNSQKAQKIISSPAGFSVKNLTFSMEYAGTVKNIDVDQNYMVMMIRVVQEILGQIAERA